MSECRHPYRVGVAGVQYHFSDMVRVFQADALPGFATVGAFVHPIARVGRATRIILARADPNRLAVGLPVYGNVADGHRGFVVEQRLETHAVVVSTPQAARGVGHVKLRGVGVVNVQIHHAATHVGGADGAELHVVQQGIHVEFLALRVAFGAVGGVGCRDGCGRN